MQNKMFLADSGKHQKETDRIVQNNGGSGR